jgi:ADP-L-glycero-D-manno-heptose 6-epimerase
MNANNTILITGAAGFIASNMAIFLNEKGFKQLVLVDDFSRVDKQKNHDDIVCNAKINRNEIESFFSTNPTIDVIIHFGARTDTTEMDYGIHEQLNVAFSKIIWHYCTSKQIPLLYASSAATYGDGKLGYNDNHEMIHHLKPLNPYGVSKNEFDKWVLMQQQSPPHWFGLKFFNVYGPNEYHKGRMASVIFHAFNQIKQIGKLKLFKSHQTNYADGGQMRDFIYVKDILAQTFWILTHLPKSGVYNAGTGKAETFNHLALAVFKSLNMQPNIEYIDTPIDIRDKYQYFTEANMNKLKMAGYHQSFFSIDEGIEDYITNYLNKK